MRRLIFAIESSMIDDSQLVEKLAKSDAISNRDLRSALDFAKEDGTSLYEALIAHELIDERLLVKLVARLLNVPPVWLGDRTPDADVTESIPRSLAVRNRVLPLKREKTKEGDRLVLAMLDPLDVLAMDEVASHTGVDVRPVFAGPYDLRGGLERAYGPAPVEDADEAASLEALEQAASGEFEVDEDIVDDELDDGGLTDDSWASFFDEAADVDNTEDSAVISRDMKDRAISSVLDAVDPDSDSEDDDDGGGEDEDGLNSLDEPLSRSQMTGGVEPDLDGWEVDSALDGEDDEQSQKNRDYAKIGQLFVYSPEKAAAQSEAEEVEPDSGEKKPGKKKQGKKKQGKKKSGKKKSAKSKADEEEQAESPRSEASQVPEPSEISEPSEPSEPSDLSEPSDATVNEDSQIDADSELDEDSEADDDTAANTEFGLGPAALRDQIADDDQPDEHEASEPRPASEKDAKLVRPSKSTNKNPAIVKDKLREMSAGAAFVEKLDDLCEFDDTSRKALADASANELIYAAVLSLVDAGVLDPADLIEHLTQS